jgi:hypothetical protein
MAKSKESVKAMITEEQLKIVNDQQLNLNELLRNIGILESQKQSINCK